ncbi:MAG TPA: alpha-E domain-containing protein [Halieaceae bacterium]|nr:alpha-E domain-containing protein [Halieaceae bacterium]
MTMLSRVAERVYWMGRYLERAECTARLVDAYHHMVMDIPRGSQPGWDILVRILDAEPVAAEHYRVANEANVIRLLMSEDEAACSIPYAIRAARENVRTTRDVLPEEVWELVNELYLYSRDQAEKSVGRRHRQDFLQEVVSRTQVINGVWRNTLCRDHAYRFIKVGQLLERADMATRIIDVGAADILGREGTQQAIDHLLWGTLLQSLSALGAYRRQVGPVVEPDSVVAFIFMEQDFPRSVRFCLSGIREELPQLKRNEDALRIIERARRKLRRFSREPWERDDLHAFIDNLQGVLSDLHSAISDTWFRLEGS